MTPDRTCAPWGPVLAIPALAILIAAAPALAGPAGVSLLSASGSTIRVGVTVPAPELATGSSEGSRRLSLPGWSIEPVPGEAALPVRVLRFAVPPTGSVSVSAVGMLADTRDGVDLEIARPAPEAGEAAPEAGTARRRAGERARMLSVSWLRNQRVATVAVYPVEFDPASRRLVSYARIEVEVHVQGGTAATGEPDGSDAFERVYESVLVNYEQGKAWRRPAPGAAMMSGGPGIDGTSLPDTSVFAGHAWVKIAIRQSGFHRINYGQLRTFFPFSQSDSIPFADVRLYAWPGRPVLAERSPCDLCDYRQVAIAFEDVGGDQKLANNQDAFYFYALGPADWADHYDPALPDSVYLRHPYENANYYFLSFERGSLGDVPFTDPPARIPSNLDNVTPLPDGTENLPATFQERLRFEVETGNEYYPSLYGGNGQRPDGNEPWAWEKFMWRTISLGGTLPIPTRTPGADPATPARLRLRSWGNGTTDRSACPDPNPHHLLDVVLKSSAGGGQYDSSQVNFLDGFSTTVRRTPFLDTLNVLTVSVPQPPIPVTCGRIDRSTLSWFELYYRRRFEPDGDELWFDSPGNGNAIYRIGPFVDRTLPRLFDITDPFAPREMLTDSASILTDTGFLPIEVNEAGRSRYAILPTSHFIRPASSDFSEASGASAENLRSTTRAADYILIYYDGFQGMADSLAAWRQVRLPLDGHGAPYHVTSVPVSAVYDQFSGGRTDPVAIRDFLRVAFYNWHGGGHASPAFVTLLGDASFDFRNLLSLAGTGQPGCLLPSFENSRVVQVQYATDDFLLNVDNFVSEAIPDFFGGRIPAFDAASAEDYVLRKLLFEERRAPTGPYRNRVMLIADDDQQGQADDALHWRHLQQTSELDSTYTPDHVDRTYVYLHTYPDGPGRSKPLAKAEIKGTINGPGVTIFNYIGHGSPFKLSDENVLIDVDAGTFTNSERLPLFVAASCDVGKFNDPRVQSLGERLITAPSGGTIGVVSATELAYSEFNARLNTDLFAELFRRSPATGRFENSVSQALLAAKLLNSGTPFAIQNNQKYGLLGDAGLWLNLPSLWVELALYDETGTTPVSEILGGQTVTVRGQVLDRQGGSVVPYSGVVDLLIEDSQPRQTSPPCAYQPGCERATYDFRAGAIYRGDAVVSGGQFSTRFVVPLEAAPGARGKVRGYVAGFPQQPPQIDAVGSIRMQVSPGSDPGGDDDGPVIALSFPGGVSKVRKDAQLEIELSDPSGILTTGHTLQNGIIVTVDGNTTARTDVTSTFRYTAGSSTSGSASFVLPNLSAGSHTIQVSAADNLAAGLSALRHRSTASIAFEVVDTPPIEIRAAFLFPNPTESGKAHSGGTFVIDGPGESVNVLVRLFTLSGRMIRELKSFGGVGQIQVPWDGYDAEGYPLANGTYLFKVYVNGRDASGRSTARQKASRDGRFVILNP